MSEPTLNAQLTRSAEISECGHYRWWLRRSWRFGGNGKVCCFIMLNPSTADGLEDDPTIRRCMGFTQSWGYSTLDVRNLFALRATDPRELVSSKAEPTGGLRGDVELLAARTADLVIAAWGAGCPVGGRDAAALKMLAQTPLYCLDRTKAGFPKHPLYCRADLSPTLYRAATN